jgi:hypothetical protein
MSDRLPVHETGAAADRLPAPQGQEGTLAEPACQPAAEEILRLSSEAQSGRGEAEWTRDDVHER